MPVSELLPILLGNNRPPTVALNTPADTGTVTTLTPTLNFTGTDADSDTVEYNVQVDTVNTFNSQTASQLVPNTGFETNTSNWTLEADYTRSSTEAHSGSWSVKQNSTTAFANFLTDAITVLTNTSYDISFWYKTTAGTGTTGLQLNQTGSGYTGPILDIQLSDTSGNWVQYTNTVTTNGVDTNLWIRFYNNNGTVTRYFDDFSLKRTDSPVIDALSASDAGFTAGHPFASASAKDYTVQSALTDTVTYYWRARAYDPLGTNTYGAWATTRSFTVTLGGATTNNYLTMLGVG